MSMLFSRSAMIVAGLFWFAGNLTAADWPQWRGPLGTGVVFEVGVPLTWNEQQGLAWKIELPPSGNSTPAIWDRAIFVTSQNEQGELLLLRYNLGDGQLQWTRTIGRAETPRDGEQREHKFHRLHNLASPSPVTDGEVVIAHFGNGDLAAYEFAGEQLWHINLADEYGAYTIWWGHANSPLLVDDLVISVCMQDAQADLGEEPAPSYVVAHDKRTGQQRWKTMRMTGAPGEQADAYTTPLLISTDEGEEVVIMGANQLDAYDPLSGTRRWWLPDVVGGRTVTSPTYGLGMIFATQGMRGPMFALRPPEGGEVPRGKIAWQYRSGTPDTCSPVVWEDLLFFVTDDGIAKCLHAPSGNLRWKKRLPGEYKASPIAAGARIYFLNTSGLTTVVAASPRYEKLAENALDDTTLASPAVSQGRIYLRGEKHLYAIGSDAEPLSIP